MTVARLLCSGVFVLAVVAGSTNTVHASDPVYAYYTRNCSTSQKSTVKAAVLAAIGYKDASHSDAMVKKWFGAVKGSQGWTDTTNVIGYMAAYIYWSLQDPIYGSAALPQPYPPPPVTFDCAGGRGGVAHVKGPHVQGSSTDIIFLDNGFWGLPVKSTYNNNSQAGAIIHEISHLANTADASVVWGLGTVDEFQLALDIAAQDGPYAAVWNANNWEYFFQNR